MKLRRNLFVNICAKCESKFHNGEFFMHSVDWKPNPDAVGIGKKI
jgi:hypothetical protein